MRNLIVTIVGRDHPGIIYQVSSLLAENGCNVIEVSQTTLMNEFAGVFSCTMPQGADLAGLDKALAQALEGTGLGHWVTVSSPKGEGEGGPKRQLEPYVVTLRGPDQVGIIPEFSGIMSGFEVNVDNLRVVSLTDEKSDFGQMVVMFFELSVPREVKQGAFRQALNLAAEERGLEVSLQHRDIFEAMHRI